MIQRRRPIESAIAKRRMFNMGGMAAPMQQMQPMGMPQQPMGMPQQAQGIMASSQPLVDAIAADAANPAGGDTLSMAQGGLASEDLMARGYRNGGINYGQNPDRPAKALGSSMFKREYPFPEGYAPFGDKILPIEGVGGLGKSWSGESSEPSTTLVGSLINNSGPNYSTGSSRGPSLSTINLLSKDINDQYVFDNEKLDLAVPVINSAEGKIKSISINSLLSENPSETYERWMSSPSLDTDRKASESRAGMLRRVGAGIATDTLGGLATEVKNVWSSVFDAEFANQYPDFDGGALATAVAQMQEQHPDLAGEILERSTALIRNNPEVGVMDFKKSIIKALSNKYELSPHTKIIDNAASEEAAFREIGLGDETTALTSEEEAQAEFNRTVADETTALTAEELAQAEFNRTVADETTALTAEEEAALSAAKSERYAPLPPTRPGAGPAEAAGTSPPAGGVLDEVDAAAYTAANQAADQAADQAANQAVSILDTDKKADGKTIDDFKKKFMEAMPKYEGMSEEEKGFLIAEAGLRVMAGKSPNAIANIAKGLQGLGPALMKDAKEKRAWNRQVELSAAKYGLENVARDAAELRADAKADRKLYNEVFRVRKGETFERNGKILPENSTVILKVGEVTDGTVDLNKLVTEDSLAAGLKAYNARLKLQLEQVQKTVTDPSKFRTTSKDYIKDSMRVRTNIATQSLLSNALAALQSPDALNIRGAYKTALLGIANSFGKKKYAMSVFDGLDTQTKFKDWTNRAVTTQIEGLINEGGKISNQERDLAREIGGAIQKGYLSGIVADKSVLESRIKFFKDSLSRDSDTRLRSMSLAERSWDTRYNTIAPGRVSYGQMLRDSRKPLSSPTRTSSGLIPGSLNWKDIVTRDPKTNAVTGLKKNYRSGK